MAETRAYLEAVLSEGLELDLSEEVQRHLVQVLRFKPGQSFVAFDGRGDEFHAVLSEATRKRARVRIGERRIADRESPLRVVLAQAVGKGDRMDWAIQKAVELGVHAIVPILSDRCNVSIDRTRQEKRLAHWRGVIVSACEQSGRTRVPELADFAQFDHWLDRDDAPSRLLLDGGGTSLPAAVAEPSPFLSLTVGPEGGFSDRELELADNAGLARVRLGPRVLRTETAGAAAMAALQLLHGDWRAP